jgi:hypothetical protein
MNQIKFIEIILGRPLRDVDKSFLKEVNRAKKEEKQLIILKRRPRLY